MLALANPGDEVIVFDPFFVMYPSLVKLTGAVLKPIDTYPDFHIDVDQGSRRDHAAHEGDSVQQPGQSDRRDGDRRRSSRPGASWRPRQNIALVSDEIYRAFCYDRPFVSPAKFNPQTIVIDGFSKGYGMTGWRLGFAHGPTAVIQEMAKLQQYTFVCAPQPFQWAGVAALDVDMTPHIDDLSQETRSTRRRARRPLRTRHARRRVLCLSEGPVGHGDGVRRRGDRARAADHSRQHLQRSRLRTSASRTPRPTP